MNSEREASRRARSTSGAWIKAILAIGTLLGAVASLIVAVRDTALLGLDGGAKGQPISPIVHVHNHAVIPSATLPSKPAHPQADDPIVTDSPAATAPRPAPAVSESVHSPARADSSRIAPVLEAAPKPDFRPNHRLNVAASIYAHPDPDRDPRPFRGRLGMPVEIDESADRVDFFVRVRWIAKVAGGSEQVHEGWIHEDNLTKESR